MVQIILSQLFSWIKDDDFLSTFHGNKFPVNNNLTLVQIIHHRTDAHFYATPGLNELRTKIPWQSPQQTAKYFDVEYRDISLAMYVFINISWFPDIPIHDEWKSWEGILHVKINKMIDILTTTLWIGFPWIECISFWLNFTKDCPNGPIEVWCRTGDRPLPELMKINFYDTIRRTCVSCPRWGEGVSE